MRTQFSVVFDATFHLFSLSLSLCCSIHGLNIYYVVYNIIVNAHKCITLIKANNTCQKIHTNSLCAISNDVWIIATKVLECSMLNAQAIINFHTIRKSVPVYFILCRSPDGNLCCQSCIFFGGIILQWCNITRQKMRTNSSGDTINHFQSIRPRFFCNFFPSGFSFNFSHSQECVCTFLLSRICYITYLV